MVKNLPLDAGDVGLTLGQGTEIPPATEQVSPRATATELTSSRAHELQAEDSYDTAETQGSQINKY